MSSFTYRHTPAASYLGYVSQAIVNNLAPLLFLTFQRQFDLSLSRLALPVSLNFTIQLLVDLAAARFMVSEGFNTQEGAIAGEGIINFLSNEPPLK